MTTPGQRNLVRGYILPSLQGTERNQITQGVGSCRHHNVLTHSIPVAGKEQCHREPASHCVDAGDTGGVRAISDRHLINSNLA